MKLKSTPDDYGFIARSFHWVMALIILGMVLLGFYMTDLDFSPFKLSLYDWHKSFGTLVLMLVFLRLGWRLTAGKPEELETRHEREEGSARFGCPFAESGAFQGMAMG